MRLNIAVINWVCIGVTLWQLDSPGRLWPWFVLGWAALYTLVFGALLEPEYQGYLAPLVYTILLAGPLVWAGWSVQPLGYVLLGWICIGAAAGLVAITLAKLGALAVKGKR